MIAAGRRVAFLIVALGWLGIGAAGLRAGEPAPAGGAAVPTMGGKQFWADELFFHQWRIQRNVWDGHYRLLDPDDGRHAWGTYQDCTAALERIKRQRRLPSMRGKAVILLHGLGRSRLALDKLAKYLAAQGDYTVLNVSYPTTQEDIGEHARTLKLIIEHLAGIDEIDFVGHSLGNIVVRHYLGDQTDAAAGRRPDPRIRRFVMIAPPNHRSLLAAVAADSPLFQIATGQAGRQLGRDWERLEPKLATPQFEFGIIAGGKGDSKGYNPLLPGDNDATITVASTRLAGAADFIVLPALHTFIMEDPRAMEYTLRFLRSGYFLSPAKRQPIAK